MKCISHWIEAMRLRTLPVSVAGVFAATGMCVVHYAVDWTAAALCLVFAVLAQIASNFANEYFDYRAGRDRRGRSGPRRGVTEGDITPRAMLIATLITLAAACCVGLSLVLWGGLWLIAMGLLIAVGVFAYSTGPYPLSTKGWGEVAVVFFFGIIPVNLTCYVQMLQWSADVFAMSLAVGLLGANVLIINNYRDVEDDVAVGKLTLAVRCGRPAMRGIYAANTTAAALLTAPLWGMMHPSLGYVAVSLPLAATFIVRAMARRSGAALTPLLGITSVLMCAYSLAFFIVALYLN